MRIPSEEELERQISSAQNWSLFFIIGSVIGFLIYAYYMNKFDAEFGYYLSGLMIFGFIFIIAIITFSGARNSVMKGYDYWKDREELRQAQLNALRRGKVNVKLKGKMRTLK